MSSKGFAPLVLLPIILVGLVLVYWVYSYTSSILHSPESQTTQTPVPTTKPESTSSAASPVPNGTGETAIWKTYTNNEFSFKYPPNLRFKQDQTTDQLGEAKFHIIVGLYENKDVNTTNDPLVSLSYWDNPEGLPIPDFSKKYLSQSVAGDPVFIWAPHYENVTNSNGINAYFDKEHYCVAICQIYVFSSMNKIYILNNSQWGVAENTFDNVFYTFKFNE